MLRVDLVLLTASPVCSMNVDGSTFASSGVISVANCTSPARIMLDRTFGSLRKMILTSPMVGFVGPQKFLSAWSRK